MVAGLNHAMHKMDPPNKYKGKTWKDSTSNYIADGEGGYNVSNSPDNIGKYCEIDEVILYAKSKTQIQLDNLANGVGINAGVKEVLFGYAGKTSALSSITSKYLKYTKILGKVTGVYSSYSSIVDAYRNPTAGNILKASFNTGILFIKVNPLVGLGIGILDATGVTNKVFNGIGNYIK